MSKKFSFNFKKIKKEYILVAVLILVALIIFFNSFGGFNKKTTENKTVDATTLYVANLENKLHNAISNISGVGKVTVKINISSSFKNVYLTQKEYIEENGKIITNETPILIGGKTILIEEEFPKICGVVIVANGSNNIIVKANILNTCVTLLGIDSGKVIILNGKK